MREKLHDDAAHLVTSKTVKAQRLSYTEMCILFLQAEQFKIIFTGRYWEVNLSISQLVFTHLTTDMPKRNPVPTELKRNPKVLKHFLEVATQQLL